MNITGGDTGIHIANSPFTVNNEDGVVHPATSTASGAGLDAGVVGDDFTFQVQAKDIRAYEIQTVTVTAPSAGVTGEFTLSHLGETTAPIDYTADETVMKTKLEELPTVGEVAVTKQFIGTANTWPVWAITFNSNVHPANVGDLPLMIADPLNLVNNANPTDLAPVVHVLETMPGSDGNNRADDADLANIAVTFASTAVNVGVKEVQEILCDASTGDVQFSFHGQDVTLNWDDSLSTLQTTLSGLSKTPPLAVTNAGAGYQTTICAGSDVHGMPEPIRVTFDQVLGHATQESGDLDELDAQAVGGDAIVRVTEIQQGVGPSSRTVTIAGLTSMKEVQEISCECTAPCSTPESMRLSFKGVSTPAFAPNVDISVLETYLNDLVTVQQSGGGTAGAIDEEGRIGHWSAVRKFNPDRRAVHV
jgi:hypothetical protein